MMKYIKSFFLFLLPIVKQAVAQVAAEELAKIADKPTRGGRVKPQFIDYSGGGARRTYDSPFTRTPEEEHAENHQFISVETKNYDQGTHPFKYDNAGFHDVLMVAFDVKGDARTDVEDWIAEHMPTTGNHGVGYVKGGGVEPKINLDSWWIADDGAEGDLDSAVFVAKGNQKLARELLRAHGLVH